MTVHQLRAAVTSVQGTLALDLAPRLAPPIVLAAIGPAHADVVSIEPGPRGRLDLWVPRIAQAVVEIVGGDRPAAQLLRWTTREVYLDLHRRAQLVARAGGYLPGAGRVQPIRPKVVSSRTSVVNLTTAEASARVRYGARSRALALRFDRSSEQWICSALEFA